MKCDLALAISFYWCGHLQLPSNKAGVNKTVASFSSCFRSRCAFSDEFQRQVKNTFKRKWKQFGPLAFVLQGSAIHIFLVFIPCYF